jgi:hypothetical protein
MQLKASQIEVGDIVCVEWPESLHGVVIIGTFEGRVVAKDGGKITVDFKYPPYETHGSIRKAEEEIEIDVGKGADEKYGERVIMRRCKRIYK